MRYGVLLLFLSFGVFPVGGQQTPSIEPKIQPTPLPAPVTLPPPKDLPADGQNRPLTVGEAVRIALRKQPSVDIAKANITVAQGRVQQAKAGQLPNVTLNGGYTHVEALALAGSGGGTGSGGSGGGVITSSSVSVPGYQATVTLRQLLFDFQRTRDLVRQTAALERQARANLTRVQSDLALQVKQAFYTRVQNERLVGVNEANVRNRQAQLALAEARLRAGLGPPSDVVRAQTAVSEAIQNLTITRNTAALSQVQLALLMGIDPRTPLQLAEATETLPASDNVETLTQTALKQRPEMRQTSEALQAAQHGLRAANQGDSPAFFATVGVSTRGNTLPPKNDYLTLGLAVQWSPFDGYVTAGRVKEARGNKAAVQAQLQAVQLNILSEVSQAWLNLQTAQQRVQTTEAEVANAEEGVRLAEGRYRAGVGTFLDVLDAQTALLTARTNRVNTLSSVDLARAALSHAIGTPLTP